MYSTSSGFWPWNVDASGSGFLFPFLETKQRIHACTKSKTLSAGASTRKSPSPYPPWLLFLYDHVAGNGLSIRPLVSTRLPHPERTFCRSFPWHCLHLALRIVVENTSAVRVVCCSSLVVVLPECFGWCLSTKWLPYRIPTSWCNSLSSFLLGFRHTSFSFHRRALC